MTSTTAVEFLWTSLRGLPHAVKWPVKVMSKSEKSAVVYIKSDNAVLTVKLQDTLPFPGDVKEIKQKCIDKFNRRKQKNTLKCFLADTEWALNEAEYMKEQVEACEVDLKYIYTDSKDLQDKTSPHLHNDGKTLDVHPHLDCDDKTSPHAPHLDTDDNTLEVQPHLDCDDKTSPHAPHLDTDDNTLEVQPHLDCDDKTSPHAPHLDTDDNTLEVQPHLDCDDKTSPHAPHLDTDDNTLEVQPHLDCDDKTSPHAPHLDTDDNTLEVQPHLDCDDKTSPHAPHLDTDDNTLGVQPHLDCDDKTSPHAPHLDSDDNTLEVQPHLDCDDKTSPHAPHLDTDDNTLEVQPHLDCDDKTSSHAPYLDTDDKTSQHVRHLDTDDKTSQHARHLDTDDNTFEDQPHLDCDDKTSPHAPHLDTDNKTSQHVRHLDTDDKTSQHARHLDTDDNTFEDQPHLDCDDKTSPHAPHLDTDNKTSQHVRHLDTDDKTSQHVRHLDTDDKTSQHVRHLDTDDKTSQHARHLDTDDNTFEDQPHIDTDENTLEDQQHLDCDKTLQDAPHPDTDDKTSQEPFHLFPLFVDDFLDGYISSSSPVYPVLDITGNHQNPFNDIENLADCGTEDSAEHGNFLCDKSEGSDSDFEASKRKTVPISGDDDDDDDCDDKENGGENEKDVLRDEKERNIYVRSVMHCEGSERKTKQKRTGPRIYNSYHCCYYCKSMVQHIRIHLKTKHRCVKEVADAFQNKTKNKALSLIRMKGDDAHNVKVLKEKKGELLLKRRPVHVLRVDDYGPCPYCKEWMLKSTIHRHQKTCIGGSEMKISKRNLIMQSELLSGQSQYRASKVLSEEVFTIMTADSISEVAQNDKLITALGESWLRRNYDNHNKRKYYASQRMRLSARLLIEARKENDATTLSMWDVLVPSKFDIVVSCALKTAAPFMDDEEDLKSPSNAIKLKYDITRLVNIKWAQILKTNNDKNEVSCCKNFLHLIKVEWAERVTKLARSILVHRQFQRGIEIPSPNDIQQLTLHVVQKIKEFHQDVTAEKFRNAINLIQTRLLCYNKRRSGEIDAISLKDYAGRKSDIADVDKNLTSDLSYLEEYLLKSQDLMVVRGKRCRPVPVIIPADSRPLLDFIANANIRCKTGISPSNSYLFATSGMGPARSYESMKKICADINLKHPERITSVSLRKYTATLSQVVSLKENELQWLCNHLGHSKRIHLEHYRQTSGLLERTEISKLMLMQDLNLTAKFKGKSLKEITFEDMFQSEKNSYETEEETPCETSAAVVGLSSACATSTHEDDDPFSFDDDEDKEDTFEPPPKKAKIVRMPWSDNEVEDLKKLFGSFFISKTTPGKKQILETLKKMPKSQLNRRNWHTIVKKISNLNHKK